MSAPREAGGVLLVARGPGAPRVLLLYNPRHGEWAPPKGHAAPGESAEQTARRELCEETGLAAPAFAADFEAVLEYDAAEPTADVPDPAVPALRFAPGGVRAPTLRPPTGEPRRRRKRVRYFLASLDAPPLVTLSPEHSAACWATAAQAQALTAHADLRALIARVFARVAREA